MDQDPVKMCLLCLSPDASPQMWRAAVWELGDLRDRRATAAVIKALEYPDWECRHYAIMSLGKLEDPAAIGPLQALLSGDYLTPDDDDPAGPLPPNLAAHLVEDIQQALARIRAPGTYPDHPQRDPA